MSADLLDAEEAPPNAPQAKPERTRTARFEVVDNGEVWILEMKPGGFLRGHVKRFREAVELHPSEVIAKLRQAKDGLLLVQRSSDAERELDRLAGYLLRNWPTEIGAVQLRAGESAVEVAIRLLERNRLACQA